MPEIVAVTGSTSSIGRILCNHLQSLGCTVIPLGGKNSEIWKLGDEFPSTLKVDSMIHLAHDRTFSEIDHLEANRKLFNSFAGRIVYLSSLSAHSMTKSKYGRIKFQSELLVSKFGGVSIRAGIVYGNGVEGIARTLVQLTEKFAVLPLPYHGRSQFFLTYVEDLCFAISSLIEMDTTDIPRGFNPEPIALEDLVRLIVKGSNLRRIIFGIPTSTTNLILRIAKAIGFQENLLDSLTSLQSEMPVDELSRLSNPPNEFRKFSTLQGFL